MSFIAAAIVGGVGALAGGVIASQGAKSAAKTQAGAATNAANIANQQWQTTNAQEAPYRNAGYGAQSQLNYLLGIGAPPGAAPVGGGSPSAGWTYPGSTGGASPGTVGHPTASGGWDMNPALGTGTSTPGVVMGQHGPIPSPGGGSALGPYGPYGVGPVQAPASTDPNAPDNSGGSTAGGFGSLLSPFTIDTFKQYSPAYQFQLQQGQQGVLNGDASNSGALSGAAQKDLIGFNQGMASTAFNNAFNQYQTQQGNIYSRLAGVAGLGQNATANTGTIGAGLAGSAAQSVSNAGTASAAGTVGAANAASSAINNAVPWLVSGGGGSGGVDPSFIGRMQNSALGDYSDIRLKTDIELISRRPDGLGVYRFRYLWDVRTRIGLMAQEVLKVFPAAVSKDARGFLMVDYGRV
jgi:hypothetical protein